MRKFDQTRYPLLSLSIFTSLIFFGELQGQNTEGPLSGVVMENSTNQTLPYTKIYIKEEAFISSTNSAGQFSISKDLISPHDTLCFRLYWV